jgi:hypothetical protein
MCTLLAAQCLLCRARWHQGISCHAGHHAHILGSIWGQVLCTIGMSTLFSNWLQGVSHHNTTVLFDNFFETTRHSAPDVSGTICWQQLANLDHAKMVLSKVSVPNQHSVTSLKTPSDEEPHTMSGLVFDPNTFDTTSHDYSILEALQVSENSHTSQQNQSSHRTDEMTPIEPTVTAGTSQRGRVCTMSGRMGESVSQQDFSRNQGMHYMASQATTGDTDEDLFHDAHFQLQEHMRNPTAFHAEMMGDIMYF